MKTDFQKEKGSREEATLNKVLTVRLSSMGDVVCTLPVASLIKSAYPDCEITWAVDKRFAGIVRCSSAIDQVVTDLATLWTASSGKKERFDAVLEMQGLAKSAMIALRVKAGIKLGYHWQREGSGLVSQKVVPDPSSVHVVDQYIDVGRALLERAGVSTQFTKNPGFGFEAFLSNENRFQELSERLEIQGKYAVLNAGAAWASKRWPPEYFGEIAHFIESNGVQVVLIGGKSQGDTEAADTVIASAKARGANPKSVLGLTSMEDLIVLIGNSQLHIGGDTGSTHIAAAVGKPAIGLFSITHPQRSCPYTQIENTFYSPTGLASITPDEVKDKLSRYLS